MSLEFPFCWELGRWPLLCSADNPSASAVARGDATERAESCRSKSRRVIPYLNGSAMLLICGRIMLRFCLEPAKIAAARGLAWLEVTGVAPCGDSLDAPRGLFVDLFASLPGRQYDQKARPIR